MKPNRKAEKARRKNQPPMSAEDAKKQVARVKAGSKMGPSCTEEIDSPTHAGQWTAELQLPMPARFLFTVEMQDGELVAKLEPPQDGEKQRWHPISWIKAQGFRDWSVKCDQLAIPPFRYFHGGFVKDATYSTVLVCDETGECPLRFSEREVEKDGHFMCPNCGRLGQRMVEATPEQCGL